MTDHMTALEDRLANEVIDLHSLLRKTRNRLLDIRAKSASRDRYVTEELSGLVIVIDAELAKRRHV